MKTKKKIIENKDVSKGSSFKSGEIPITKSLVEEAKKYKSADEFVEAQTNAYHGTPGKEFSEFKLNAIKNTENETNGLGVWVTPQKEAAKTFSNKIEGGMFGGSNLKDVGGTVMSVRTQLKNPKIYESSQGMESILDDIEKLEKEKPSLTRMVNEDDPYKKQNIKDKRDKIAKKITKLRKEYKRDAFEHFMDDRDQFAQYINKGASWEDRYVALEVSKTNKQFIDYLKKQGHDGIIIKGTEYDAKGAGLKTINQIVSFDPKNVLTKSQLKEIWEKANKLKKQIPKKKITLATIKSFTRRQKRAGNLHINLLSSFDGMVDCVMPLQDGFQPVEYTDKPSNNNLGVSGAWVVGQSRDSFEEYADEKCIGYKIYNCCGSFILAMKRAQYEHYS